MKKITVIGAGATGHAIAADLSLKGFDITLYEQPGYNKNLNTIIKNKGIKITGAGYDYLVNIHKCTSNIKEAVTEADIIIIAVVATRHEKIADLCVPYLQDGQTILITPGNMGSLTFRNKLAVYKEEKNIIIGEVESNLYVCTLKQPSKVELLLPPRPRFVAAFPAKENKKLVDTFNGIYETKPAVNVLEASLNLPNVDSHLAGSILNTGIIEKSKGDYHFYQQALTPGVLKCIEAVYKEKDEIMNLLGYENRTSVGLLEKLARDEEPDIFKSFKKVKGPASMQHRFIDEDAAAGTSLIVSLGNMLGIETPVCKSLLTLANLVNEKDYLQIGKTVENLGMANMNNNQLNKFLREGSQPIYQ